MVGSFRINYFNGDKTFMFNLAELDLFLFENPNDLIRDMNLRALIFIEEIPLSNKSCYLLQQN